MTTKTLNHLCSQISTRSESERAALARELIMSMDGPREDSVEQAWNDEIVRRVSKVKSRKRRCSAVKNSGRKCERG